MLAERRDYETYLRSGWRRGGGPDSGVALQFKFNPNHDPENGQFTFADGGATSGGGEIVVTGRRAQVATKPRSPQGPFKRRANEVGIDGEVVDKLNKLVEDPHASVDIKLNDVPVTISRTGPDTARVSGRRFGFSFGMNAHFGAVAGKEAVVVSGLDPKAPTSSLPAIANVDSFPSKIVITRGSSGRMIYNRDKSMVVHGPFGVTSHHAAGSFYFKH